jgi:hypothetical protein
MTSNGWTGTGRNWNKAKYRPRMQLTACSFDGKPALFTPSTGDTNEYDK